jgi:hypothetical protein
MQLTHGPLRQFKGGLPASRTYLSSPIAELDLRCPGAFSGSLFFRSEA